MSSWTARYLWSKAWLVCQASVFMRLSGAPSMLDFHCFRSTDSWCATDLLLNSKRLSIPGQAFTLATQCSTYCQGWNMFMTGLSQCPTPSSDAVKITSQIPAQLHCDIVYTSFTWCAYQMWHTARRLLCKGGDSGSAFSWDLSRNCDLQL